MESLPSCSNFTDDIQTLDVEDNSPVINVFPKPQLKFKDKIDNSQSPFKPIIKEKPNCIKPLAIYLEKINGDEIYCHPYELEIKFCQPSSEHLEVVMEPNLPKTTAETPYKLVSTIEDLNDLLADLEKVTEFGVDLEHHSLRSYQGIACLMQLSTRSGDYIVDALELRSELHLLNKVFTDPKIVKVFHGANNDVRWLQKDFGIYVVNMFDTGQAASVLELQNLSLNYLAKHYCEIDLVQEKRSRDWRIRPLPPAMINYARNDARYLIYIYDRLKKDLFEKANQLKYLIISVFLESKEICLVRYRKPHSFRYKEPTLYKYSKQFDDRQKFALRELIRWRDSLARDEDESREYILPDKMVLQIAQNLPRTQHETLDCCKPNTPPFVLNHLSEIQQIIIEALQIQELVATSSTEIQNKKRKISPEDDDDDNEDEYDDNSNCKRKKMGN